MKKELTPDRVREIFNYDPLTGELTWRTKEVATSRVVIGHVAGGKKSTGYVVVQLGGRPHGAHRIAWMHFFNAAPTDMIDHINGVKDDNRIANLREVSRTVNAQNQRRPQSNNKSGFLGVSIDKRDGRWTSRIKVDGKYLSLGRFKDAKDAGEAYVAAKRIYHIGNTL